MLLQFWVTVSLLDELRLRSTPRRPFWSFLLLGLVTGLGILFGFILLVIPGIILWVRWSISVPALIADDKGYADAIAYSWGATRRHFWPILGTFAAIYIPAGVSAGAILAVQLDSLPVMGTVLSELAINGSNVVGWHAAIAIFAALRPDNRLSEIFA